VKRADDSFYSSDVDELLPLLGRYTRADFESAVHRTVNECREYADVEAGRLDRPDIAAMQVWDILRTVQWG